MPHPRDTWKRNYRLRLQSETTETVRAQHACLNRTGHLRHDPNLGKGMVRAAEILRELYPQSFKLPG